MIKELWHGSSTVIEHPEYGRGNPYNDYGRGFYCTESRDLAKEWASVNADGGYANHYVLQMNGLNVLDLSDDAFSILNWLSLLIENRNLPISSPVGLRGIEYLTSYFLIDTADFDLIIGYRADDSYFSFARAFLNNMISLEQLSRAMKLGKQGEQIMLKSPEAFARIEFIGYEIADGNIYHQRRMFRDMEAREAYQREAAAADLGGLYMRDIIMEEVRNDDPRLR